MAKSMAMVKTFVRSLSGQDPVRIGELVLAVEKFEASVKQMKAASETILKTLRTLNFDLRVLDTFIKAHNISGVVAAIKEATKLIQPRD